MDKVWYKSKTIWLLIAQLMIIVASVITKEVATNTAIALSFTTIAGFITRYYTSNGITLKKE